MSTSKTPVTREQWESFMDGDGRVVAYNDLKRLIFRHGIEGNELRREIWKFLFGFYSFHSTYSERETITREKHAQYFALRKRWLTEYEQGEGQVLVQSVEQQSGQAFSVDSVLADIYAKRLKFDLEVFRDNAYQVDKDVPRTDRELEYFNTTLRPENTVKLRNILMTYSAFHPEVGYVQGMNDVLSMMLVVLDDEADTYTCFASHMLNVAFDFQPVGMKWKLKCMGSLLKLMDSALYSHISEREAGELFFCHRWLHVSFKREFSFENAVRLFETIGTQYVGNTVPVPAPKSQMENPSQETEQEKARKREDKRTQKRKVSEQEAHKLDVMEMGYTFELFFSLAILKRERERLLQTEDIADIYALVNGLVGKLDLDEILASAEETFAEYCERVRDRIAVDDGLPLLEGEEDDDDHDPAHA